MTKKYNTKLLFRILITVSLSIIFGYLLSQQLFWASGIVALFLFLSIQRLFAFQKRNAKDLKRLIDAIRFSEFNVSFRNFEPRGLSPELISGMENSITRFSNLLLKMEAEQGFYYTLLDKVDFSIFILDKRENIKWINKPALDLFAKSQPRRLSDLSNISETLPQTLRDLLPKETKVIEIDEETKVSRLVASVGTLVSEGKELKLISLKNIQSVLEESESEAWKKLISVLTHEMMNSIAPILSLAETFAEPTDENRNLMPQAMQTIHRRSKGLVDFVHNYQQLSRIPNPTMTTFSAMELMQDLYKLLATDDIQFTYTVTPSELLLKADRSQMEQVMINLIKNAIEATSHRENPQVTVEIINNELYRPTIRIIDNGDGILPDVIDKVFIPFFSTKPTGSGIGLSICRQIVQLHGGTISVTSDVGKGSVFTIGL